MKVNVSKLQKLTELIVTKIVQRLGNEWVEIPENNYWDVKVSADRYKYNDGNPPKQIIKDLIDDCHRLKPISDQIIDKWPLRDKVCLLVHVSNLLRAIGEHADVLQGAAAPPSAKVVCDPES